MSAKLFNLESGLIFIQTTSLGGGYILSETLTAQGALVKDLIPMDKGAFILAEGNKESFSKSLGATPSGQIWRSAFLPNAHDSILNCFYGLASPSLQSGGLWILEAEFMGDLAIAAHQVIELKNMVLIDLRMRKGAAGYAHAFLTSSNSGNEINEICEAYNVRCSYIQKPSEHLARFF